MDSWPVVIIGAGPTGLVAANLLGKAGIDTLVIERNEGLCSFSRAIAIDDEGLRVCQATGLVDEILAHARLNVEAHYLSRRHFLAKVAPIVQRNGYPLITTFHQPTLERTLLKGLERFAHVKVLFQHTLETFEQNEHGVHIYVRTPEGSLVQMACTYLLACDGGKSSVRRMLAIPMRSPAQKSARHRDNGQKWLVVDGVGASEPSDRILFFCDPLRPAVSVPGPGQQRRWEFMLLPGESEEEMVQPATIQRLIRHAMRGMPRGSAYKDAPFHIVRQAIYTFHALIAARFVQGRVFLLGDAAHLMPPFGGQGMNSGLRDAHNLCWKLQLALQGETDAQLLESYHVERHAHAGQMIVFSSLLGAFIMTKQRSLAILRDLFFHGIINRIGPMREALTEMRVKPQPRYTSGFLLKDHGRDPVHGVRDLSIAVPQSPTTEGRDPVHGVRDLSIAVPQSPTTEGRDPVHGVCDLSIAVPQSPTTEGRDPVHGVRDLSIAVPQSPTTEGRDPVHGVRDLSTAPPAQMNIKMKMGRVVGVMLPQPYVLTAGGERVRLDDVLGDDFVLVGLYKDPHEECMGIRIYHLGIVANKHEQSIDVLDIEKQISMFLGYRCDMYVLVRPDRYVMGVF